MDSVTLLIEVGERAVLHFQERPRDLRWFRGLWERRRWT